MIFDTDEHPRFGTTLEELSKLKPAFKQNGTITAGNASGLNDGASAVVVMSREESQSNGHSSARVDTVLCIRWSET